MAVPSKATIINSLVNVIIGGESDDSDYEDLIPPIKNENANESRVTGYVEKIVPAMTVPLFISHFKLSPDTVRFVQNMISQDPSLMYAGVFVDLHKQLLMTLWILATPDSFRSVADRFGVAKSTSWYIFERVCASIARLSNQIIKWPTLEEMNASATAFEATGGFPGVIGCIDGTHIEIKAPNVDPDVYVNRHGYYSLVLQGIVNNNLEFINCYAGEVGSVHDATIFGNSRIGQTLQNRVPENFHLLGDSAYPLGVKLITPFRDNGHLTREQVRFNQTLSRTRSTVERSFGLLKGRFRRLKYLDMTKTTFIPTIIIAACVLHNITRKRYELDDGIVLEDEVIRDDDDAIDANQSRPTFTQSAAAQKRFQLLQIINN